MTEFTKYDPETGLIEGRFSGNPANVPEGIGLIEGFYSGKEYIVVDGIAQRKSEEELQERELNEAWFDLKSKRTRLLQKSDWTQVPDAPVDSAAWAVYRQQLRDLPANTTDPRDVTWPVPPS